MSTSATMSGRSSSIFDTLLDRCHHQCEEYLHTELNQHLLMASKSMNKGMSNHYLTEYQRCLDEENSFRDYIHEQLTCLDALKSSEMALDAFLQRLKTIHEYELKQNEVFEQVLHELTKRNPSSKEERLQLLHQIDELIVSKSKLPELKEGEENSTNKLAPRSSDTFKNLL